MGASLTAFDIQPEGTRVTPMYLPARRTALVSTCNGEGATMECKVKDDLEDIPVAYLWYTVLVIIAIVATSVAVVIRLF
jgi:hypothetical protein